MVSESNVKYTTIVNKYPSFRDDFFKGCWRWLEGRRADDNAEGLWRVHDKLYNLKEFIGRHPGGKEWLILTKGIDITEPFESYHITTKANDMLSKFYVRDAVEPRNYRLTYEHNGFYMTLKRRVAEKLKTIDKSHLYISKLYLDLDVIALFLTAILAARLQNKLLTLLIATFSGVLLAWLNTFAHNFIHQANNWRMYSANIVLTGWRDWRVFHGISHHLYPNSYSDFEVSSYEPVIKWIPILPKSKLDVVVSYLMTPVIYLILFHATFTSRVFGYIWSKTRVFYWDELLSLTLPLAMLLFGNFDLSFANLLRIFGIWNYIIIIGSFAYSVVAVNAGHHGPQLVHEGDEFTGLDFGIYQLGATIDRIEAERNLFMILTHFGEHMLHHMFPSLDHVLLPQLKDIFIETVREFEGDFKRCTLFEALISQFQQLGRTETIKLS